MISSIGTPTSSLGRGCRATAMDQLLLMANVVGGKSRADSGQGEALGLSPGSWPGLTRPPRLFLLSAFTFGVAGTSPATTPLRDSHGSPGQTKWFNKTRAL